MKKLFILLVLCCFTIFQGCEKQDFYMSDLQKQNVVFQDFKKLGLEYKNELNKLKFRSFEKWDGFESEYKQNMVLDASYFNKTTENIILSQEGNSLEVEEAIKYVYVELDDYFKVLPDDFDMEESEFVDHLISFIENLKINEDYCFEAIILAKGQVIFNLLTLSSQIEFFETAPGFFEKENLNRGKCRGWEKVRWIIRCTGDTIEAGAVCGLWVYTIIQVGIDPFGLGLAGGCYLLAKVAYECWKNGC